MGYLSLNGSGKWDRGGIEQPGGEIVHQGNMDALNQFQVRLPIGPKVVVLKVPGHTYWTGIGMPRAYAGATYQIFEVREVSEDGRGMVVDHLLTFPASVRKGDK
jgi:hypothetical protein